MDTKDRITYAQMNIEFEWNFAGNVLFVSEENWEERFLKAETVDPLNAHKPYGLVVPSLIKDDWVLGVCVPLLLRPVEYCGEQDMNRWLEYWMAHMAKHLFVLAEAAEFGESNLPLEEIEQRVLDRFEQEDPGLHEFGERVKAMME